MSIWTHVSAVFRVDGFQCFEGYVPPDWDAVFGKECLFESPKSVWDDLLERPEEYLPCGSEGTLEKSVWVNPDKSCSAAYTVSVFGDLRDWSDSRKIVDWFSDCCLNRGLFIRNAVIDIEVEGVSHVTARWQDEGRSQRVVILEDEKVSDIVLRSDSGDGESSVECGSCGFEIKDMSAKYCQECGAMFGGVHSKHVLFEHDDDRVETRFMSHGFHCAVRSHPLGHRCGYVAVPEGHPAYGMDMGGIDAMVDVHGGVTYSEEQNGFWVFGFDTMHVCDLPDESICENDDFYRHAVLIAGDDGVVWTTDMVVRECESMASQLKGMMS